MANHITQPAVQESVWQYFLRNFKHGFKYAFYTLVVGACLGTIYGLFAGIIIQPALFVVGYVTILVCLNYTIALISYFVYLLFRIFKYGHRRMVRYFALSSAFFIVFVLAYMLLFNTGLVIF